MRSILLLWSSLVFVGTNSRRMHIFFLFQCGLDNGRCHFNSTVLDAAGTSLRQDGELPRRRSMLFPGERQQSGASFFATATRS
ncbi:hypothetical protein P170DRAFT_143652 [Aspergillus steynii IBT 23096]|uniref:Secreted protein n=1 Tax=Aspergillus steynii IBT 23096 TaxID=1392250 RepID=A0A2I2GC16_9EURO|nr:uncharacterized protein P170DRAFT_143652 [Aspergillus steynii IBT 23096]PLB50430.1 hypothetical protein P170DRAFT_143652 [Aspergillus steynii IBT 23096]